MATTTNLAGTKLEVGQAQKEATINSLFDLLDASIAGRLGISTAGGTTTLTGTPAAPQAQNLFLDVSGTLASNGIIEIPIAAGTGRNRLYVVKNGTSGAFSLTVRKVGGTGVTVTQGYTAILLYNDTDIVKLYEVSHSTGLIPPANLGGAWTSWSPTWTNLTVGNGTVTAFYFQIGKLVICRFSIVLGSTSAVSGDVDFTLPVTRATYGATGAITPLGDCQAYDVSATFSYLGHVLNLSTTKVLIRFQDTSGTYAKSAPCSSTVPFTWTTSDELAGQFCYEAA